jgi:hypothetical protein
MLVTGVMMLRKRREVGAARCTSARCTSVLGVSVGLLTGVVGAGGGFVVVPALAALGGLPMPEAIATSLLVIGMNSITGFLGQIGHVSIDARVARDVTIAAVVGSLVGAMVARRLRPESLRRGFAVLVLGMAGVMAYGQICRASATSVVESASSASPMRLACLPQRVFIRSEKGGAIGVHVDALVADGVLECADPERHEFGRQQEVKIPDGRQVFERELGQVLPRLSRVVGELFEVVEDAQAHPRLEDRAVEVPEEIGQRGGQDAASFLHHDVGVRLPDERFPVRADGVLRRRRGI